MTAVAPPPRPATVHQLAVPPPPPAPAAPVAVVGAPRRARVRAVAVLRIAFGLAWGVDATLKWLPGFRSGFVGYVTSARAGQPQIVKDWLGQVASVLSADPHLFAYLTAAAETAIAVALIAGALTNLVCVGGSVLSLLIWATAEGFGGPYMSGSTDIGTSIIYVFVFALLAVGAAGATGGADRWLRGRLGRLGRLCSAPQPAG